MSKATDPVVRAVEAVTEILWRDGEQAWDQAAMQAFRILAPENREALLRALDALPAEVPR